MSHGLTLLGGNSDIENYARTVIERAYADLDKFLIPDCKVIFNLTPNTDDTLGVVKRGTQVIEINLANIQARSGEIDENIRRTFLHEYSHVLHARASDIQQIWASRFRRIQNSIPRSSDRTDIESEFVALRLTLFLFHELLLTEGIANFLQYYLDKQNGADYIPNTYTRYRFDYETCFIATTGIKEQFTKQLAKFETIESGTPSESNETYDAVYEEFYAVSGPIGRHMIHSILGFDSDITIDQILLLTPDAFILLYEKVLRGTGFEPLVSFNAKGVFSYGGALKELINAHAKFAKLHRT